MSNQDIITVICPECGAENNLEAQRCWLCHGGLVVDSQKPLSIQNPYVKQGIPLPVPAVRHTSTSETIYAVMTIGVFVLVVMAGVGIYLASPRAGLAYALLISPGCLATGAVVARGKLVQDERAWNKTLMTLLTVVATYAMTAVVAIVVVVALVVAAIASFFAAIAEFCSNLGGSP